MRELLRIVGIVLTGALLAGTAMAQGAPCDSCGPGPHWIDTCAGATDQIADNFAIVGIDLDLDCVEDVELPLYPSPPPLHLLFIARSDPRDDSIYYPGLRPLDGHQDVIDTEIVQMSLTGGGFTLTAGAGLGQGGLLEASRGATAELASGGPDYPADSFFDVFIEVEIPSGEFLYNQTPIRVETEIECVPPDDADFAMDPDCIPLFTSPIPGMGYHVANMTRAHHRVNPRPSPVQEHSWGVIKALYR